MTECAHIATWIYDGDVCVVVYVWWWWWWCMCGGMSVAVCVCGGGCEVVYVRLYLDFVSRV